MYQDFKSVMYKIIHEIEQFQNHGNAIDDMFLYQVKTEFTSSSTRN